MSEIFVGDSGFLFAFRRDCMAEDETVGAILNDKLFETMEVQLINYVLLAEYLDI